MVNGSVDEGDTTAAATPSHKLINPLLYQSIINDVHIDNYTRT